MTISMSVSALSSVPGDIAIYLAIPLLFFGGVVWYALYKKGDVRAVFSHGRTILKLEAKERTQSPKPRSVNLTQDH
jgi:hypothetical protein